MALTYDLTACNSDLYMEGVGEDRRWAEFVQPIIFATMSAGIGHITDEDAPEFYARVNVLDAIDRMPGYELITPKNIHALVGLRTNVSHESRTVWMRRVKDRMDRKRTEYLDALS